MTKIFSTIAFFLLGTGSYSQQLSQVTFTYGGDLSYFTISSDQGVLLRITQEGQLMEWGTEEASLRNTNYFATQLLPYQGRVENYGDETDSAYRGKVKSIGTTTLTWYAKYEMPARVGRIKSIGRLMMDYYDYGAEKSLQGKIKSLGNLSITYYSTLAENEAYRGKLKSIGNTTITYYSSFDDREIRGKIKSIGPVTYTWYTSLDINKGGLKSGSYRTNINGVTFIIR